MGKWTLERWVTIGLFVFTLGTNWQRIANSQSDLDKLKEFNEKTLPKVYVPREIYDVNQQHLTDAINRLTETLDKILETERETGEPARVQGRRMFDK
jgi:hypothetical protein